MTAVASPPSFKPSWGMNGGQAINAVNPDDVRAMFMPRKTIQRSNSASSISSNASNSSTSSTATAVSAAPQPNGNGMPASGDLGGWANGAPRKRPQTKGQWPAGKQPAEGQADFVRMPAGRPPMANGPGLVAAQAQQAPPTGAIQPQGQPMSQNAIARGAGVEAMGSGGQPVLYLLSLNGTFERKTITVPFYPETLRIGRQTNTKTVPLPVNGFFDSKVLSRQHAEIWADRSGKIWIRDVKSSNGTFVNGARLSPENRESEPHELQTQDHLELGIDIVSEDQKTVVHHKVAAKVEHAGFLNTSNNLLDMNFGDLDPSNGGMIPLGGMPFRGRTGSQASAPGNGRMVPMGAMNPQPNALAQRQFWLNPITTEHIVKRLHNEMRTARLQSQDLARTGTFISALLTSEDVKNQEKPDGQEAGKAHGANGNGVSFRSDGAKNRFSDPPAPPPQAPLPEKPDVARPSSTDIPSLKRGVTERPKSTPANTSPIRQDNLSQIIQLTEALNNAKRDIDNQNARMRDLEEMLQKEREAREVAEDVIQKMEEAAHVRMNGAVKTNGPQSELHDAFEPPVERPPTPESIGTSEDADNTERTPIENPEITIAAAFQARIDSMMVEMRGLREQLDLFKQRAEKAEAERDADRQTLAEMVLQIRQRDEEERLAAERKARSPTRKPRSRPGSSGKDLEITEATPLSNGATLDDEHEAEEEEADDLVDRPTLSRSNTITPSSSPPPSKAVRETALVQSLPYASMIGVVLIGMGLMAYLNGWQPPQERLDR